MSTPHPLTLTATPSRSYGVGIARSGRRGLWAAEVATCGGKVTSGRRLSQDETKVTGREMCGWDTVCRPNVVLEAPPAWGSSPGGSVRTRGHRFNESRTSGNPAQTHEAPTRGLFWSTTAEGGSNHERGWQAMSHGREEYTHLGDLTATPGGVRAADDVMTTCGSPIEQAFLRAFLIEAEQMGWCATVRWTTPEGLLRSWCPLPKLEASETQCWVELQAQLGPHRVDFAITACHASRPGGVLRYWEAAPHVVECDGHDYHSSREQRTADAERDRFLTARGFRPVRLTGTELHRNPHLCALEVLRLVRLNPIRFTSAPASEQVTP